MPLALRSVLAIGLMIGFYLLAFGMVAGLLGLVWMDVTQSSRIHPRLVGGGVLGSLAILWAVAPRLDRWRAPGPELTAADQPTLFRVIEEVAEATGQRMPEHVYLVADVNAFVTQRGGFMGVGSRRVMGLGLPLMAVLSVDEVRAVVAHEFGHFHGGDTRLGPFIYRTRTAIERTVDSLGESWLVLPFAGYSWLYLRITHAVSRAQEYAADALAARTQGAAALADGLRKIGPAAAAFHPYWRGDVAHVIDAGRTPPLAEGFARFCAVPHIAEQMEALGRARLEETEHDPHDTHPPTIRRIEAIGSPPPGDDDGPRGTSLLHDLPALEARLVAFLMEDPEEQGTRPLVAWDAVPDEVLAPHWHERGRAVRAVWAGTTLGALDVTPAGLRALAKGLGWTNVEGTPSEDLRAALTFPLAAGVASQLMDDGWTMQADVGKPLTLTRGDQVVLPDREIGQHLHDPSDSTSWHARWEAHGLADLRMGPA